MKFFVPFNCFFRENWKQRVLESWKCYDIAAFYGQSNDVTTPVLKPRIFSFKWHKENYSILSKSWVIRFKSRLYFFARFLLNAIDIHVIRCASRGSCSIGVCTSWCVRACVCVYVYYMCVSQQKWGLYGSSLPEYLMTPNPLYRVCVCVCVCVCARVRACARAHARVVCACDCTCTCTITNVNINAINEYHIHY